MEYYQIFLLIFVFSSLILAAAYQIYKIIVHPVPPTPNPPTPSPTPSPTCNKNWQRTKELFFVAVTAPELMNNGVSTYMFSDPNDVITAFARRHKYYTVPSKDQINGYTVQGFNPPASATYDPSNIWLLGLDGFTFSNKYPGYRYTTTTTINSNQKIVPYNTGFMLTDTTGVTGICGGSNVFSNAVSSLLHLPLSVNQVACDPTIVSDNIINVRRPRAVNPKCLVYPLYGYKPNPTMNKNTMAIFQGAFLEDQYDYIYSGGSPQITTEILPFYNDSTWYYKPLSGSPGVEDTNGKELLVFKISAKAALPDALVGVFQASVGNVATLDDLEYSFTKGYNREEYIAVNTASGLLYAKVNNDTSTPRFYGINTWPIKIQSPTTGDGALLYSSGVYSGTILDPTRQKLIGMDNTDITIALPSRYNPGPPIDIDQNGMQSSGTFYTRAFWGVRPPKDTWITNCLTPKYQSFGTSGQIELLPFTQSTDGFFISGTPESWSMYCTYQGAGINICSC